jgi:hypothetical protein
MRGDTCVINTDPKQNISESDPLFWICDKLNEEIAARLANRPDHPVIAVNQYPRQFLYYAAGPPTLARSLPAEALRQGQQLWERIRVDEQIGPTGPVSGTTNLVSRGSVPTLVGLAVEAGALAQSTTGSTATFRANAGGLWDTIIGRDAGRLLTKRSAPFSLSRLSLAAAFDLSRPGSETVPVSGNAMTPPAGSPDAAAPVAAVTVPTSTRQLSSFVARYQVLAPRELGSVDFAKKWKDALAANQNTLGEVQASLFSSVEPLLLGFMNTADYRDWRGRFQKDLQGSAPERVADITRAHLDELVGLVNRLVPDFLQKAGGAANAYSRYFAVYQSVVDSLQEKPLFAFEYTYSRPAVQPDLHNFRLIYGWNPAGGKALISLNAAGTFYGSLVPNASKYGRVRDMQAAFQVDRPFGAPESGLPVFTLAGYYQYQVAAAVLQAPNGTVIAGTNIELPKDASVLLTPKGNMVIAQAKLTIRMKDTGVKIPVGVTWSNRSELIKANDVRGHIGLTYDFDSLLHRP